MEDRPWNEELFEEFCTGFTRERNRLHGEAAAAGAAARQQLAIHARLAEHMDWVATGEWRTNPQLDAHVRQQMTELLAKKADLAATIVAAERAQRTRPLLHPEMGKLYREWVIDARNGLRDADRRTDAMTALRAMVEEIVLTPEQGKLGIVLKSDLAAMPAFARLSVPSYGGQAV